MSKIITKGFAMKPFIQHVFFGFFILTTLGCSTKSVNSNAPLPSNKPHYIDTEIEQLAKQLIDEKRKLANIREAKLKATTSPQTNRAKVPQSAIFSGLETKRTLKCEGCDLKVALQSIAVLLGWDINSVYEVGRKPAQGVPVSIELNNEPLRIALQQIKMDAGHIMDLRIDPNFKSMLIEYKTLGL